MPFHFVDRITSIVRNRSITTQRYLSSTEQYLKDHFPGFPVMPGVLILESAVQSASWLLRYSDEFDPCYLGLTEVSNVKFGQFVKPGDSLEIKADLISKDSGSSEFQARAFVNSKTALRVRFRLKKRPLRDTNERWGKTDKELKDLYQKRFRLIAREAALS
ncbi:MAG: beta-hydroxyacyl-ACP dehydratase [Candidatus Omnitrophica bacterium]|nr:beta-hydroxyacyl-ACP dehydratase [Candidatus Omnitrophota bacterium]